MSAPPDIVIVGAGVAGLTAGVRLAEENVRVRIRADRMPLLSTSAAAGAIWDPGHTHHRRGARWSTRTHAEFVRQAGPGRASTPGVRLVDGLEASRKPATAPIWISALPSFRACRPGELPPGYVTGWRYQAPIIDMPIYLRELERRLLAAGGEILPGRLETLGDAFADAPIVVNCSGAGARELVPDPEIQPVRGHLVAVRNPGIREFFAEYTDDMTETTYLLPQGEVLLLGGSAEKGETAATPDAAVIRGIVERCALFAPEVAAAEVLGHRVGIRPVRPLVRLEHVNLGRRHIVHNYGHGGSGVSVSWGCADDVAAYVLELLGRDGRRP